MSDINELKLRWSRIGKDNPASTGFLNELQERLMIKLPDDFIEICRFYDGSGMDVVPMLSCSGLAVRQNVLSETLRLRDAVRLPSQWLVLSEPPESLIVMECPSGRVLWVDAFDAARIGSGEFVGSPNRWETFLEFFAFLLDEEESENLPDQPA